MSYRSPQDLLSIVLLTVVGLALAGCWEVEKTADVNPDGSARLRVDWRTSPEALQMEGLGDTEDAARRKAADIVRGASGVDAWTDVSWTQQDGVRFSGTAYVPDLSDFELEDGSGNPMGFGSLSLRQREDGRAVIEYSMGEEEEEAALPELSEEEALAQAQEMLGELRQTRSMAAGLLIDSRESIKLRVSGEATEVTGFTATEDGLHYEFVLEGEDLLDAMRAILDDGAEWLAGRLREAADAGMGRDEFFSSLVTERLPQLPARIVFEPGGSLFDYSAAVAAAKEDYTALVQRLGLAEPAAEAGEGEAAMETVEPAPAPAAEPTRPEPEPVTVEGPPEAIYLQVGRSNSGSFDDGTKLRITLPSLAGQTVLGLATERPANLSVKDGQGRDLIAASDEAFEEWQAANPNTFTTRKPVSWQLGSTRGEPPIPYVELNLWATPSPGTGTLRVQGEVRYLGPPETTETAPVPPGRIADDAVLELGGEQVTLSRRGSWSQGGPRYVDYAVEGDVVVVAVRRAGEVLWQLQPGGSLTFSVLEELPGDDPVELEFGAPASFTVPLDLSFGLGLQATPRP